MALDRLLLSKWTPDMITEYEIDLVDRDAYASVLAGERAEGEQVGMAKGEQIGMAKGVQIGMAKGEQLGIVKHAKRLVDNGRSKEDVVALLNLSMEQEGMLNAMILDQGSGSLTIQNSVKLPAASSDI
jgi:hypothetical protein